MSETRMVWRGPIANFLRDFTRFVDLEGALNSGKTTACLWKVYHFCQAYPGIWCYMGRFTDGDTQSKLVPAWTEVCKQGGEFPEWNGHEQLYRFRNGARVYCFGLKAADSRAGRYAKLRGLGVSVIYIDQGEELPPDFFGELGQRLRQPGPYPQQFILSPNPLGEGEWLSEEFPIDDSKPGRKYYHVSLYDNAHNLPAATVAGNESLYPPGHAAHRTKILGLRGLNVTGNPVYAGAFDRARHVRSVGYNPHLALCEAMDFGQHHPCVVWAQFPPLGGLSFLGGVMGQDLYLEDFLPIVQQYRGQWFPDPVEILQCCDPAGTHANSQGVRQNALQIIRGAGFQPVWKDNSNAPDVRRAMIERLASYMRRRTPSGEAFAVETDPARWMRVTNKGVVAPWAFLADGFEAGYVWDVNLISVGSKKTTRPKKDGWYEHGQNCAEYLELNFGGTASTKAQLERAARRGTGQSGTHARPLPVGPGNFGTGWLG